MTRPRRYEVLYEPRARRELQSLPIDVARRIALAISALASDPRPPGRVKLGGANLYRIRIGDYRVIYEIRDRELVVLVVRVARRDEAYRRL